MDDRYRGDDPRRSVRLASSANNGATRDRAPLPLGVNERTRGVGSRPMNGNGVRPGNGAAPHPEFRPPARAAANAPVYRGPRTPRSPNARAPQPQGARDPRPMRRDSYGRDSRVGRAYPDPQTRPTGRSSSGVRAQNQPSRGAGQRRTLNGSYAHTPSRHRSGKGRGPRAGYVGGPLRGGRNTGRIFSRPTWRSVLFSPRGIAVLLVIAVIGAGGLGINAKIQRDKAEEAARIEAKRERELLAKQTVDPFKLGPTAIPVSTPRSQWTAGTMPYLYQTDPLWANKPYAGSNIRIAGCGPTSLSMVYTYLTGKTDLDPVAMASFAEEHNFAPTGATEWRFMTDGAAAIGLRSTPVAPSRASIASALDAGMPIICCLTPGDFTTVGHFLVIKGMDSRGMVEIHDPNSPYNSAKRWPISQVLPQIEALWAFSL